MSLYYKVLQGIDKVSVNIGIIDIYTFQLFFFFWDVIEVDSGWAFQSLKFKLYVNRQWYSLLFLFLNFQELVNMKENFGLTYDTK